MQYVKTVVGDAGRRSVSDQGHWFGEAAGFMGVFHLELADDFLSVTAYGMYADVEEVGDFGALWIQS